MNKDTLNSRVFTPIPLKGGLKKEWEFKIHPWGIQE